MPTTTRCLWSLPTGVRAAVIAEADRRGTTPSRLVAQFFTEAFPGWVADALHHQFAFNARSPYIDSARAELDEVDPRPTAEVPSRS